MSGMARHDVSASATDGASVLDRLIPAPAMRETDEVIVAADPTRVWQIVRHLDLATSRLARFLFAVRTLPNHLQGQHVGRSATLDDLISSPERPGFQILLDRPPHDIAVGAIGKVWHLAIPFVHVADADAFARFDQADFVKVAWAVRVDPHGTHDSRVKFELRVAATDAEAWRKFRRYFRLIGPGSHFIRHSVLRWIAHAVRTSGTPCNSSDGAA